MSQAKNAQQAERWLQTAEEDLRAAQALARGRFYAQACFHAQQSAEKAIKSLWYYVDADPWGHSVQRLIIEFSEASNIPDLDAWIELGALLDKFYIPTRYPNGLPDLTPGQVYRLSDAERGLEAASALLEHCRGWLAGR
jgi:HEPN domain-containing protein